MRTYLACLLLAACTSSGSTPVELCATGQALALYREGSGAWKAVPPPGESGKSVLPVSGDYEILTVDKYPGDTFTTILAGTVDETRPIDSCPETERATVDVTGHLTGSLDMVWLDSWGASAGTGGGFDLTVVPGTHDLVATDAYPSQDGTGHIVLHRGLNISGAMDVGTIDPTTGTPLQPLPLTITNAGSSVTASVSLRTSPNDFAYISSTSTPDALVMPLTMLQHGDEQRIFVWSDNQGVEAKFTGAQTSFALPPPLTGITFSPTATSASWAALPDPYSGAYLFAYDSTNQTGIEVSATKGWLDAHHATSLQLATDAPGYQPMWAVTTPAVSQLTVWRDDGDFTYYASASANIATPARVPPAWMHARLATMR